GRIRFECARFCAADVSKPGCNPWGIQRPLDHRPGTVRLRRTDRSHMTPFAQEYAACRCEWGTEGLAALAPADVTIIVDVFTFTTCVDVALGAGAIILPYQWDDPTAADYAARNRAELAGKRRLARYSLAPECYADAPAGLRCVLPSPNGARITLDAAARSAVLLAACLRNAEAVATTAERLGRTINVIPCGER